MMGNEHGAQGLRQSVDWKSRWVTGKTKRAKDVKKIIK